MRCSSGSDDIKSVDLTKVHNLSGPIAVEGAEPGDCLVVDILDGTFNPLFKPSSQRFCLPVVPFENMPWGFTVFFFTFLFQNHRLCVLIAGYIRARERWRSLLQGIQQ